MSCFKAPQMVIYSSFLKAATSWTKVFDEMMKFAVTSVKPTFPYPRWVKNGVLNYIVAERTCDFIFNLFSLNCRTLRYKSSVYFLLTFYSFGAGRPTLILGVNIILQKGTCFFKGRISFILKLQNNVLSSAN